MAMKLEYGSDGIITAPARFAGRHVDEVMEYLEHLEAQATAPAGTPPAKPAEAPKPKTPQEALDEAAKARTDSLTNLLVSSANRLEQDDEEGFAKTVPDYDKYREAIKKAKANMQPQQKTMRDLHRQMYIFLKSQEPREQARLLGQEFEEPEPEPEPAPDSAGIIPTPPAAPAAPVPAPVAKPRAVPPASAAASPGARQPAGKPTPPGPVGLKGNLKTERIAASMGISHDKYLEQLVGRGTTQEELNAGTAAAGQNPNRPKSRIYG